MLSNQNCYFCQYWMKHGRNDSGYGLCIRFPPVPVVIDDEPEALFPETHQDQMCGEFIRDPDMV